MLPHVSTMLRIRTVFPALKKPFHRCSDRNYSLTISAPLVTLSSVDLVRKKLKRGKLDIARKKLKDKKTLRHTSPASSVQKSNDCLEARLVGRTRQRWIARNPKWIYRKQKPLFEKYWSAAKVKEGLEKGDLVQGVISVGMRECFVLAPRNGPGFLIPTLWDRNRALEGDVVVVQPHPPILWKEVPPGRNRLSKTSNHSRSYHEKLALSLTEESNETSVPLSVSEESDHDELAVISDDPLTTEEYRESYWENLKFLGTKNAALLLQTARVVHIRRRVHDQLCNGFIKTLDKRRALLAPVDHKLPMVVLPLVECPADIKRNADYRETQFQCRIVDWPKDSPHAFGKMLGLFGVKEEIEMESNRILLKHGISTEAYSPAALNCLLPHDVKWKIPQEEVRKRRDFRKTCVVSIDPATAQDLDDALHCTELSPGVFEVGVHIADVSFFVEAGTALDSEAADRATSVYLVQRAVSMLPKKLCEDLCSLNPNEDRLSFSILWKITDKGKLLAQWIGRSMIRSVAKLSYEHAQMMIDNPGHSWKHEEFPSIADEKMVPHVVKSVNALNKLAKMLRSLRKEQGSLHMDKDEMKFTLSTDSVIPIGFRLHQHRDSNKLIEEFMLLANMSVARHLIQVYPNLSLLRYHPPPKSSSLDNLKSVCASMGITLDTSTAGTLQRSLDRFECDLTDRGVDSRAVAIQKQVLIHKCLLSMEFARYFCTGAVDRDDGYHHYALNVPYYTHFTSPIRRYADLLVHRILASSIDEGPLFNMPSHALQKHTALCNVKKRMARLAGESSNQLYLAIYLRELDRKWAGPGMVTAVTDRSFDVYIPEFGLVERIQCNSLGLERHKYQMTDKGPVLTLKWKAASLADKELSIFTPVQLTLHCTQIPGPHMKVSLCPDEIRDIENGDL